MHKPFRRLRRRLRCFRKGHKWDHRISSTDETVVREVCSRCGRHGNVRNAPWARPTQP